VTGRFVVRRTLQVVPTVFGILTITFLLVHLAPGDPALDFAGEGADQAQIDAAREYLGLDHPLAVQYVTYLRQVVTGDLGTSFVQRRPVTDLIADRIGPTLLLSVTALALSTLLGLLIGSIGAHQARGSGTALNALALAVYSLPAFWVAQLAILAVALKAGLLPAGGFNDARAEHTGLDAAVDSARHLILPALVLSLSEVALLARVTRTGLISESRRDYLRAALAKGLSQRQAMSRHALRNALLPVLTVIGSRIGFLVSGAVLVETVFAWPGLGRLLVESAQAGDHPVILGMVLLVSLSVIVVNLVTDLVFARIDPRITYR
jgi:peptide/nickel transport system permease protein